MSQGSFSDLPRVDVAVTPKTGTKAPIKASSMYSDYEEYEVNPVFPNHFNTPLNGQDEVAEPNLKSPYIEAIKANKAKGRIKEAQDNNLIRQQEGEERKIADGVGYMSAEEKKVYYSNAGKMFVGEGTPMETVTRLTHDGYPYETEEAIERVYSVAELEIVDIQRQAQLVKNPRHLTAREGKELNKGFVHPVKDSTKVDVADIYQSIRGARAATAQRKVQINKEHKFRVEANREKQLAEFNKQRRDEAAQRIAPLVVTAATKAKKKILSLGGDRKNNNKNTPIIQHKKVAVTPHAIGSFSPVQKRIDPLVEDWKNRSKKKHHPHMNYNVEVKEEVTIAREEALLGMLNQTNAVLGGMGLDLRYTKKGDRYLLETDESEKDTSILSSIGGKKKQMVYNVIEEFKQASLNENYFFRSSEVPQGHREQSVVAAIPTPAHDIMAKRISEGGHKVGLLFIQSVKELAENPELGKVSDLPWWGSYTTKSDNFDQVLAEREAFERKYPDREIPKAKLTYHQELAKMLAYDIEGETVDPHAIARSIKAGFGRRFTNEGDISIEEHEDSSAGDLQGLYDAVDDIDAEAYSDKRESFHFVPQEAELESPSRLQELYTAERAKEVAEGVVRTPVTDKDILLGILGNMTTSKSNSGKSVNAADNLPGGDSGAFTTAHMELTNAYRNLPDIFLKASTWDELPEGDIDILENLVISKLGKVLPEMLTNQGYLNILGDIQSPSFVLADPNAPGGLLVEQLRDALPEEFRGYVDSPSAEWVKNYGVDDALKLIKNSHKTEGGIMREKHFLQGEGMKPAHIADKWAASGLPGTDPDLSVKSVTPTRDAMNPARDHNMNFRVVSPLAETIEEAAKQQGLSSFDLFSDPESQLKLDRQVGRMVEGTTVKQIKDEILERANPARTPELQQTIIRMETDDLTGGKYLREWSDEKTGNNFSGSPTNVRTTTKPSSQKWTYDRVDVNGEKILEKVPLTKQEETKQFGYVPPLAPGQKPPPLPPTPSQVWKTAEREKEKAVEHKANLREKAKGAQTAITLEEVNTLDEVTKRWKEKKRTKISTRHVSTPNKGK